MSYLVSNLKFLIDRERTTGYAVSLETGIDPSTINRIVRGDVEDPRDKTVRPIADYFGISVNDLKNVDLSAQAEAFSADGIQRTTSAEACRIASVPELMPRDAARINVLSPQDYLTLARTSLAALTSAQPSEVRYAIALDDSMQGEIEKGEVVLIDTRAKTIDVEAIYAFTYFGRPHIKRGHVPGKDGLIFTGTRPRQNTIPVESEEELKGLDILGKVFASFQTKRF